MIVKTKLTEATRRIYVKIEGSAYNLHPIYSLAHVETNQTSATDRAFSYATVSHLGHTKINNLQAFLYGGYLYFWFQQPRTVCGMKVTVWYHGNSANYVDTITNEAIPTSGVTCLTAFTEYQGAFTDSNVASATKLQTARTIWGQSFDGTGDVSGAITGATTITASGKLTVAVNANDVAEFKHSGNGIGVVTLGSNGTYGTRLQIKNAANTANAIVLGYDGTGTFSSNVTVGGTLSVNGATTIYTSANPSLIIKRNASYGAANMMLLPDNQETYGWIIGAQNNTNNRTLAFIYRNSTDTELANLTTDGYFRCNGLYVSRTTDGAYTFHVQNIATTQGFAIAATGGGGYFEFHTNTSGTTAKRVSIANNGAITTAASVICSGIFVNQSSSTTATGIGLWGTSAVTTYGIYMATTANYGVHGGVTSSGGYATYFQMNATAGRGWIWRGGSTNVASINTVGLFTTNGDQVISSDASKKRNWRDLEYGIEDIAKCTAGRFDWIDGHGTSVGSKAQDWLPLVPELVHGEKGNMTLAYGQIALVNSILLARHETEQDREIRKLKARVRDLEKQLEIRS